MLLSVAGLFLASLLPIPGNIEVKIVKSGSMEPAIRTGSIVIVKPEQEYSIGDVITFGKDTRTQIPTTHRIYSMHVTNGENTFVTKGDANEEPDGEETRAPDVIGKVVIAVPFAGYVLDFARQPLGFVLMIAVPATIIIIDEAIHIIREIANLRRRKRME